MSKLTMGWRIDIASWHLLYPYVLSYETLYQDRVSLITAFVTILGSINMSVCSPLKKLGSVLKDLNKYECGRFTYLL